MALTLGDIVVNIKSDTSQLTKGFKRAESTVSKASKTMVTAIKTLTVAYIGLNAIDLVGNLVKQADAMTLIDTRLKLATKSTEELVKAQKELFDISQEARVGFSSTVDLFERITRSTRDYGTSQKEIIGLTETINKAMVISGGTAQSMNAAIIQLGQAFSADFQAVGQELASIREQAPRLYQALLEGTKLSSKAFKKHAEDGKLSTQIIIDALKTQAESVGTEFEKVNLTVDQSQTRLQNSSLKIIGMFDDMSGASSFVAESISDISKSMDELTPEDIEEITKQIKVAAITIVTLTVGIKGYTTATKLATAANIVFGGSLGGVNRAIVLTTISTKALSFAMRTIPFVAVAGAIALIADSWLSADEAQKKYNKESDKLSPENLMASNRARVNQLNELIESGRFNAKTVDMWRNALEKLNAEYKILKSASGADSNVGAVVGLTEDEQKKQHTSFLNWKFKAFKKDLSREQKEWEIWADERQRLWDKELKEQEKSTGQMWENIGDIAQNNISGAIQAGLDGDLNLDAFASQLSKAVGQAMLFQGGLTSVAGLGLMAFGSLLGGEDRETSSERAERELESFLDGLDTASKALEAFGNFGSSLSNQITSMQREFIRTSESLSDGISGYSGTIEEREEKLIADLIKSTQLFAELQRTVSASLADTLDISALSTAQLTELTVGIDIEAMKALDAELNNIALSMKLGTNTAEDAARATQILTDSEFAYYKDLGEAIDILAETSTDAADAISQSQKAVNEAMLGSLSYLSDVEKLNFANNIFQTATTPEDRISSSRTIAEISRGTTRTKEEFIPDFQRFINELEKQDDEATTKDVVDKLDEVVTAINEQTSSATEDAIYAQA